VICLDPGHQKEANIDLEPVSPGSSTRKAKVSGGTRGVESGKPEYEIVLDVGMKLKALLEKEGATVIMTRESNDVDISNVQRAQIGNLANADMSIRLHCDGNDNNSINGISMLVPAGSTVYMLNPIVERSHTAGNSVLITVINETGARNRGISKRSDMTGFNWSKVPVILIEMGFLTNPEEDRLLNTSEYQNKLAAGILQGLIDYFN
jgi:N-acetylmuramoyl-L-alanine amidase